MCRLNPNGVAQQPPRSQGLVERTPGSGFNATLKKRNASNHWETEEQPIVFWGFKYLLYSLSMYFHVFLCISSFNICRARSRASAFGERLER